MVYPDAMRARISAMTAVELSGEDLNAVNFLVNSPVKTVELPRGLEMYPIRKPTNRI